MNISQKKVVIVDDDAIAIRPFLQELEISGIEVELLINADECFDYGINNSEVDLYIIDVMLATEDMDNSRYNSDNTMNFLLTGCALARDLRSHGIETPVIFFTQMANAELLKEINNQARDIGNCAFLSKSNMAATFDFRDIVQCVLEKGLDSAVKKDWFSWIYEAVLLQPNVAGLGMDGKVLANGPSKRIKKC